MLTDTDDPLSVEDVFEQGTMASFDKLPHKDQRNVFGP
jgi:hypothetical protein